MKKEKIDALLNKINKYMKNWKTTFLGFIAASILLATSKGYIDTDTAAFIGSIVTLVFGIVSSDVKNKST